MVEIMKSPSPESSQGGMIRSMSSIESEILRSCVEFVEEEYERSDHGDFVGSFCDACDIFGAGILIIYLGKKYTQPFHERDLIRKCTALLTSLGETFTGLRPFRRVLCAVSDAVLDGKVDNTIAHGLPPIVPNGLRNLIQEIL